MGYVLGATRMSTKIGLHDDEMVKPFLQNFMKDHGTILMSFNPELSKLCYGVR